MTTIAIATCIQVNGFAGFHFAVQSTLLILRGLSISRGRSVAIATDGLNSRCILVT